MNIVKTVKIAICTLFLSINTHSYASSSLQEGSVLPGGKLIIPLNSLNKNVDYDVYCNITDITENTHNASVSIGMNEIRIKRLELNGDSSKAHFTGWRGILPEKTNMLAFTFIKFGDSGNIEFRNEDTENSIVVSDCKAYLTS